MTEPSPSAPPVTLADPEYDSATGEWHVTVTDQTGKTARCKVSDGMVATWGSLSAAAARVLAVMPEKSTGQAAAQYQPGCSKGAGP